MSYIKSLNWPFSTVYLRFADSHTIRDIVYEVHRAEVISGFRADGQCVLTSIRVHEGLIDIWRSLGNGITVADDHADKRRQVGHCQCQTVRVDIRRRDLSLNADSESRQSTDEVIGEHNRVGNFVGDPVQVDVTSSID
jgi:hypothetical protein